MMCNIDGRCPEWQKGCALVVIPSGQLRTCLHCHLPNIVLFNSSIRRMWLSVEPNFNCLIFRQCFPHHYFEE